MKDLLLLLDAMFGVRYTRRQKFRFLKMVVETVSKLGYESQAITERGTHVFVGDRTKAKKVIAVGYDTPTNPFIFDKYYYPFDESKNRKNERNKFLAMFLVLALIVFGLFMFVSKYPAYFEPLLNKIVLGALLFGLSLWIRPHAKKINYERYSAGIAIMFDLMSKTSSDSSIGYLLIDQSNANGIGFKVLDSFLDKEIILLGTLSNHPNLKVAGFDTDKLQKFAETTELEWEARLLKGEKVVFNEKLRLIYLVGVGENEEINQSRNPIGDQIDVDRLEQIAADIVLYLRK